MRAWVGIGVSLALGACGKPAATQDAAAQAPDAPQVRIAQVGGTVFTQTVSAGGTVTARPAEAMPGPAAPGAGVSANGYMLLVPLLEQDAARVALGATAQVRFAAFENDVIVGRVIKRGAPMHGVVAVEIALPRDARLQGGQVGTARIAIAGAGTTVIAVPPSAVAAAGGGKGAVFVVDLATSRLHQRGVTLGAQDPDGIRVTAGLAKGEWVALTRTDQLKDGMKIAPVGPAQ